MQPQIAFRTTLLSVVLLAGAVKGLAQTSPVTILYSFQGGTDGAAPKGAVIIGTNGALYGTTSSGGANSCTNSACGTVFELTPSTTTPWIETVIHNFNGSDGQAPQASLVWSPAGSLFGTTLKGGSGAGGTVFELTPPATAGNPWTEATLYNFTSFQVANSNSPYALFGGLLLGSAGELFATTFYSNYVNPVGTGGTIFKLKPPEPPATAWTESTVMDLYTANLGAAPYDGLLFLGGSLYGTASDLTAIGTLGCGTVFEATPPSSGSGAWTGSLVYRFAGPRADGCFPKSGLTAGPGGVLYGTTLDGGSATPCAFPPYLVSGCGVVFQLTPPAASGQPWSESIIYTFTGANGDGAYPAASLLLGKNGALYGTTQYGGSSTNPLCHSFGATGCGTVFALNPPTVPGAAWTETVLHCFTGENGDGAIPTASLVIGTSGILYGTTSAGGAAGQGAVFALKP